MNSKCSRIKMMSAFKGVREDARGATPTQSSKPKTGDGRSTGIRGRAHALGRPGVAASQKKAQGERRAADDQRGANDGRRGVRGR